MTPMRAPSLLDGDHRLVGEGLQEGDLLVGEGLDFPPPRRDDTDEGALAEHRDGEDRLQPFPQECRKRGVLRVREYVSDVHWPALERGAAGRRLTAGRVTKLPEMFRECR
jgi:hypothetical protein